MASILVIDDDKQIRSLIRQMLEREGHEVAEAGNGVEGLATFTESPAHLVVIDLFMPEAGGWETIRALQRRVPGVPVIVISGGAALEGLGRGDVGTLDSLRARYRVLRKPFDWSEFSAAVTELLTKAPLVATGTR
ncbi:MAG TPA: response regulator [Candidatus Binatia bacterium]|jgi:CheY-like chemotaxis protein|nr:response regulator [Candidatus Binatia bacterium]